MFLNNPDYTVKCLLLFVAHLSETKTPHRLGMKTNATLTDHTK